MLVDMTQGYLDSVKAFADRRGPETRAKLNETLEYLNGYACKGGDTRGPTYTICLLGKDSSPQSFSFRMMVVKKDRAEISRERVKELADRDAIFQINSNYEYWFNGGVIYYGQGETGTDKQYSVRIGDTSREEWTINT